MKNHVKCNICGEDSAKFLFEKQGFNIVKCRTCGLVYVNPRLSDAEISSSYIASDYFNREDTGFGYRNYIADSALHLNTFDREFRLIEELKKGGRLLDIGCAAGFSLKAAKERGWNVTGIEISQYASAYAAKEFCIEVFNGTLEQSRYPDHSFDLVISYGTIEHTPDPLGFIREIHRILKDDGMIVICTPDIGSWLGNRRFQYKPLEHLYYFNRDTMKFVLNKAGFDAFFFRGMRVNRSIRFILERLKYYFSGLTSLINVLESLLQRAGMLDISFFIPDGQMVAYARKVSV